MQIDLDGVTKSYGRGAGGVDDLRLAVAAGERLAVLGPSGAGKTTLLRLIAGLESPDAGTIRLGGRDMNGVPPHFRGVAMVFQNAALYPHLNARENLAFGLKARGVPRRERHLRAAELAESLGLRPLLDRRPGELSGGERQRVALGRALAPEPAVLLLDEPFSNLDEPLRIDLRAMLLDVHRRHGCTIVHVTHDQAEALALGQQVAVMHRGLLLQCDTPQTVHDRPASLFVAGFVGSPGMNLVDTGELPLPPRWSSRSRVILGFRPEHVEIAATPPAGTPDSTALVFTARVRNVQFQGHSTVVSLDAGGRPLTARVPSSGAWQPGQDVTLRIREDQINQFDPDTSGRIAPDCQPAPDAIA